MKRLYIAATEQHAGKTTVSVGLYRAAARRGCHPCFIKPVGQRYVIEERQQVDEDAVLFKRALAAEGAIKDLSPVTIPRGFTSRYIFDRDPGSIHKPILEAVSQLEDGHDLMVVEGTGHAGVGAVVDASNAEVARILEAKVIIVSSGGIGRCIDQIVLNQALFDLRGVPIIGAVVNKVFREKYDRVSAAVHRGLENVGIRCLGVIPYQGELTYLSMLVIQEEFGLEVLCGGDDLEREVKDIVVAAMEPQNMINYLTDGCLVVVPGDRVDNIVTAVTAHAMGGASPTPMVSGLVLTGGLVPHASVVNILEQVNVPVLLTTEDTSTITVKISDLVPKLRPHESAKIALAEEVICQYVDTDAVFAAVGL
jgi:BioD-like phosphotransacetylase family protein